LQVAIEFADIASLAPFFRHVVAGKRGKAGYKWNHSNHGPSNTQKRMILDFLVQQLQHSITRTKVFDISVNPFSDSISQIHFTSACITKSLSDGRMPTNIGLKSSNTMILQRADQYLFRLIIYRKYFDVP
jgi:hypothetical protein